MPGAPLYPRASSQPHGAGGECRDLGTGREDKGQLGRGCDRV